MRITKYLDSPNIIYFFEKYDDDFEPTGTRNFNGSPYDLLRDLDFIYYSPAPLQNPADGSTPTSFLSTITKQVTKLFR